MATSKTSLEQRVSTLETQMEEVLAKPAFRRKTEEGVCAKGHPDSNKCPEASLGRMQGGCHGHACLAKGREYYQNYRARRKAEKVATNGTPVANPKKRAERPAAVSPKKASTIKRPSPKAAQPVKKVGGKIKRPGA